MQYLVFISNLKVIKKHNCVMRKSDFADNFYMHVYLHVMVFDKVL